MAKEEMAVTQNFFGQVSRKLSHMARDNTLPARMRKKAAKRLQSIAGYKGSSNGVVLPLGTWESAQKLADVTPIQGDHS